ncbi:MAG: hypothetical protein HY426_01805 [Candidatus Levybacteria bacterium]|nr:hypothetical protein [Candidatus Levybacteria bacterium]
MAIKFFSLLRKNSKKPFKNYKEETLIKHGAEQFKKLADRGIELPVVLL